MRSAYHLHLQDKEGIRVALYDPYSSQLVWKDTGEKILPSEHVFKPIVEKTGPQTPVGKTVALKKIKIQMGFACNYSCSYCSQNNQRNFQKDTVQETLAKVPSFLDKMQHWFDGGEDGKGKGVKLEFWGGETLLYWSAVEIMARKLRSLYPQIGLALFTNGSILSKEMADTAAELKIHFIVSHDGPTFNEDRAKDPLDIPAQAENLKYLFNTLSPLNLISFNATVSPKNYSFLQIRDYIARKLQVQTEEVKVTHDLATPYDSRGLLYVSDVSKRNELINVLFHEYKQQFPFQMEVGRLNSIVHDFFGSLTEERHADSVGQKCSMDLPTSIAVDIDGNVLTCQNVTAKGGHKIGHIDHLAEAKLSTAWHWSKRQECVQCPVVQICKGACMFLENKLWEGACNQHFTWGLAYLALALYWQTNRYLVLIDGAPIRSASENSLKVLDFVG